MPISWGEFGPGITNKITPEAIFNLGKSIDEALATGRRIVADLSKDEKLALESYRKIESR